MKTKKRTKNEIVDLACTAIDDLEAEDFSTEAMTMTKEWLEAEGASPEFPAILIQEFCADAMDRAGGDALTFAAQLRRFAIFLVFLAGREAAEDAMERASGNKKISDQATLILLGRIFGMVEELPPDADLLEHARPGIAGLVKGLGDLPAATGELLTILRSMPGLPVEFLTGEILKEATAHPKREHFAVGIMLTPCEDKARCRAAEWLIDNGGSGARQWLDRVQPAEVGDAAYRLIRKAAAKCVPERHKVRGTAFGDFSLTWPVTEAYASQTDGQGSQGLYLVRETPRKKFVIAGAVVSDVRGIADGLTFAGISATELDRLKRQFMQTSSLLQFPVEPAYVIGRIRQGMAFAENLGMPLPLELDMVLPWLAGLWDQQEVDVTALARKWARPELLIETGSLAFEPVCESWFITPKSSKAAEGFFEEAAEVYEDPESGHVEGWPDASIAKWVEPVVAPLRRTLAERLAHVAYLFDRGGDRQRRDLAATAACAFLDQAKHALIDHPFARALMLMSTQVAADDEDDEDFNILEAIIVRDNLVQR